MNLFVAWRDSLTILQPKNLKLFLLVTLKSMVDAFKVWIKYFWWLPIAALAIPYFRSLGSKSDYFFADKWFGIAINIFMGLLWLVSILLAIRPSVAIKNCAYFRSYIWRMIYVLPVYLLAKIGVSLLVDVLFYSYIGSPSELSPAVLGAIVVIAMVNYFTAIYLVNYTLFVLDSDGSVRSFLRSWCYAAKMTLYNYPFYFIFYFVISLIRLGISTLFQQITTWYYAYFGIAYIDLTQDPIGLIAIQYTEFLVFALLSLFTYCFLTNFYIKKLHDQFTLYFGKNE